jgi:hypothetical protein
MTSYIQGKEHIDSIGYTGDWVLDEFNLVDISTTHVSGNIVSIKNTPGSSGNLNVLRVDAAGANWTSALSGCVDCVTEDASVTPVKIEHASNNKAYIMLKRPAGTAGYIWIGAADSIKLSTTANDVILFLPNGTGYTHCGAGTPGKMASLNDNYYVPGKLEVDGKLFSDNYFVWKGTEECKTYGGSLTLPDDGLGGNNVGTYSGWGRVQAGDNEEWAEYRWDSAPSVTIESSSANVANSDSDGNLCIYFSGNSLLFKNRLGATKVIGYEHTAMEV